jgi:hypothetical protein
VCVCGKAPGACLELFSSHTILSQGPKGSSFMTYHLICKPDKVTCFDSSDSGAFHWLPLSSVCCAVFDHHVLSNNLSYRRGLSNTQTIKFCTVKFRQRWKFVSCVLSISYLLLSALTPYGIHLAYISQNIKFIQNTVVIVCTT